MLRVPGHLWFAASLFYHTVIHRYAFPQLCTAIQPRLIGGPVDEQLYADRRIEPSYDRVVWPHSWQRTICVARISIIEPDGMLWSKRTLLDSLESLQHRVLHRLAGAHNPPFARINRAGVPCPQPLHSICICAKSATIQRDRRHLTFQQALLAVVWRIDEDPVEDMLEVGRQI